MSDFPSDLFFTDPAFHGSNADPAVIQTHLDVLLKQLKAVAIYSADQNLIDAAIEANLFTRTVMERRIRDYLPGGAQFKTPPAGFQWNRRAAARLRLVDIRGAHEITQVNIQLIAEDVATLGLRTHPILVQTILRRSQEMFEAILDSFAAYPL